MASKQRIILGVAAAVGSIFVLALVAYIVFDQYEVGAVQVPRPNPVESVRLGTADWSQGWPEADILRHHHISQGTKILPLSWFRALEVPLLDPVLPKGKLAAREYLSRFGFLYDPKRPKVKTEAPQNKEDSRNLRELDEALALELPIGFAIDEAYFAPYANPPVSKPTKVVGLTCSACHTGRLDVQVSGGRTIGVLIEGGSAMINLSKFQEAVGKALAYTLYDQARLNRFIAEVRNCDPTQTEATIKEELEAYVKTGIAGLDYAKEHKLYNLDSGFARTDALGLIGNRVFGPLNDENQTVADAPVNFPPLWDTAWFDWVQYNASIRLPMARNIGEALGVGASVKPAKTLAEPYESTVRVENLDWMETFLGGDEPLHPGNHSTPLQPPRWADFVKAIEAHGKPASGAPELADVSPAASAAGAKLYTTHCERCHLPPRKELLHQLTVENSRFWEKDERSGKHFLRLEVIDLSTIGTDPNQAANFYRRFAVVPNALHGTPGYGSKDRPARAAVGYPRTGVTETISAEEGLYRITSFIRKEYYDTHELFKKRDERLKFDRYRTLPIGKGDEVLLDRPQQILTNAAIDDVIRANLGYKARPLDGIWATPPYLHNGSVPNLYQMLVPAECRDMRFYVGSTLFDPEKVGYRTEQFDGAFLMDTTLAGNRNTGHEFRNFRLEEFERAMQLDRERDRHPERIREERWKTVFQAAGRDLPQDDKLRWKAIKGLTDDVLNEVRGDPKQRSLIKNDRFLGVPGVLGSELEDTERWKLIDYLKSL
jgi:hypothetical protein